jgi:periplasmic protein TonB
MGPNFLATSLMPARSHTAAAAIPFSLGVHVAVVGGLLALPLMGADSPPVRSLVVPIIDTVSLTLPVTPVAAVPPAIQRPGPRPAPRTPERPPVSAPATTPVPLGPDVPDLTAVTDDSAACVGCALTTGPGSPGNGEPGFPSGSTAPGVGDGTGSAPLVVGGHVSAPAKLRHVDPVYPELAKRAGVQGKVEIECVIDRDGRVASTRVVRGVPLLDAAALAAVEQWRYRPTLLNGVAVPVLMTVTVHFRLR